MSGQPVNTALDQRKFRDSYMANMRLRAEIDDKNLQANKVFHRTGQVPQEMTDYRTTTEKISDIYKLKLDVQSELLKLTDVTEALAIVTQLTSGQIQFLAQNIKPITADLASRFKYGVTEAVFMPFFLRYMQKYENNLGVEQGLSQESGDAMMASIGLIQANMATTEGLVDLAEMVEASGMDTRELQDSINEVQSIVEMLPAIREQLARIQRKGGNALEIAELTAELNRVVQDIPSKDQIDMVESRLTDAIRDQNRQGVGEIFDFVEDMMVLERDTGAQVNEIKNQLDEIITEARQPQKAQEGYSESESGVPLAMAEAMYAGDDLPEGIDPTKGINVDVLPEDRIKMHVSGYKKPYNAFSWAKDAIQILEDAENIDLDELTGPLPKNSAQVQQWVVENNDTLSEFVSPMKTVGGIGTPATPLKSGSGVVGRSKRMKTHPNRRYMTGSGMPRKEHRADVIKIKDIDFSKGVLPEKRFIPFGRYVINQNQLGKGIIAIKRPCGATIKDFPSERVSKKVHNIVNDIVGGNMPSFTAYQGLDDEEKSYLHRLTEVSNIENRLKLPAPNKDTEEQEINRFEILRGEITAGNDNPKMVKEFKLLIMKLGRKKLLPAAQVKELIFELTSMGY
mgnify:CR=1 FL=1